MVHKETLKRSRFAQPEKEEAKRRAEIIAVFSCFFITEKMEPASKADWKDEREGTDVAAREISIRHEEKNLQGEGAQTSQQLTIETVDSPSWWIFTTEVDKAWATSCYFEIGSALSWGVDSRHLFQPVLFEVHVHCWFYMKDIIPQSRQGDFLLLWIYLDVDIPWTSSPCILNSFLTL